jgi:hypothetical protein
VVRQTESAALKAAGDNKSAPFTRSLTGLFTAATLDAAEKADKLGAHDQTYCGLTVVVHVCGARFLAVVLVAHIVHMQQLLPAGCCCSAV